MAVRTFATSSSGKTAQLYFPVDELKKYEIKTGAREYFFFGTLYQMRGKYNSLLKRTDRRHWNANGLHHSGKSVKPQLRNYWLSLPTERGISYWTFPKEKTLQRTRILRIRPHLCQRITCSKLTLQASNRTLLARMGKRLTG